jgi:hypothetical protein
MAEGDTIHRSARRLAAALGGKRIVEVATPNPRSPLRLQTAPLGELRGDRVERVEARGKHLLVHFESGLAIHSHLGMHGSWRIAGRRFGRNPSGASPWVILSTGDLEAAQFGGRRPAPPRLPACRPALSQVQDAGPLARPGGRQPDDVPVRGLPGPMAPRPLRRLPSAAGRERPHFLHGADGLEHRCIFRSCIFDQGKRSGDRSLSGYWPPKSLLEP